MPAGKEADYVIRAANLQRQLASRTAENCRLVCCSISDMDQTSNTLSVLKPSHLRPTWWLHAVESVTVDALYPIGEETHYRTCNCMGGVRSLQPAP